MSLQRPVQSFDEKAVLAELERLRESIQVARRARQRTSDEFEAFVKGFRTPAAAPTAERAVATPRAPEVRQAAIAESISRPLQSPDPPPSAVVPANTDAVEVRTAAPLAPAQGRRSSNARLIGVLAVIAVIAVGLLSTLWPRHISPPTPANAGGDTVAPARNTTPPPPAASQVVPPVQVAHSVVVELKTVRPVWMRVVVDGRTDVEGMVQGGELHFAGDESIVVRVGNGGDVLVKTGNREEPFGEVGQPLTRRFSKP